MGNRQHRQENWEANERGGDYRMKYRSWRQGEAESGPFNTPTTLLPPRDRAVSTAPRPTVSAELSKQFLDSSQLEGWIPPPLASLSVTSSNGGAVRSQSAVTSMQTPAQTIISQSTMLPTAPKRRPSAESFVFPPEVINNSNNGNQGHSNHGERSTSSSQGYAPSVNEMLLDELSKAVTDELVGPEFTPVTKPSPKPTSTTTPHQHPSTGSNEGLGNNERKVTTPRSSQKTEVQPFPGDFVATLIGSTPGAPGTSDAEETKEEETRVKMVVNHLYAPVYEKVKDHLKSLPDWYSSKTPPQEVARHIRTLLEARRCGPDRVAVSVSPQYDASLRLVPGLYVVVVCAKDRRQLLDAITRCVSTRASISEATIVTTGDGFALDRFVLSLRPDEVDRSLFDDLPHFGHALKEDIENVLAVTPASPSLSPYKAGAPPSSTLASTPNLNNGNIINHDGNGPRKRKSSTHSSNGSIGGSASLVNIPPVVLEQAAYTGRFEVPFQEIRLVKVLGEGRTGKTYLAEWNGSRVAAKVMSIEDNVDTPTHNKKFKSNLDEFRRELHLVSKLSHPNIVKFLGASARPPRYILLFELCEGGDLGSLIRQKDRKYSFFQIALDIANGLAFLHRNDVIHRDVKPENLMLDKQGRVKVADFGLSCYASGAAAEFTAETGTYRYMAPEVMRHEHYSFPADVYSFGLVCYVLLSRRLPFDDCTPLQAAMAVARQDARPKLPSNLPKPVADLIIRCWSKDPQRRPDFEIIIDLLTEYRGQLNHRSRRLFDWGHHEAKKKSITTSPFSAVAALATTAI